MDKSEDTAFVPAIDEVWEQLHHWAREQDFTGWDPYDGLNSPLVQRSPLWRSKWARIAVTQLAKHCPVNLRPLLAVRDDPNPKGLGLFLSGLLEAERDEYYEEARNLASRLGKLRSPWEHGAGWGYPFPWQSRLFYLPPHTPTIVVTSYVGDALLDLYQSTSETEYLDWARSAGSFILEDLNRTYSEDGRAFCWSYSPIDETEVYNASLLGSRLLARLYSITGEHRLREEASASAEYVARQQGDEGEWVYGSDEVQQWIDNFHTGFNLECLYDYARYTGDSSFDSALRRGLEFYSSRMFSESGAPKYYASSFYPIDIHSCAQAIVTLVRLRDVGDTKELGATVVRWTLENMWDERGYFYFQKRKFYTNRIPYMRWSQAWMHRALALAMKVY